MSGIIKNFDSGKNVSFITEGNKDFSKYSEVLGKIKKLLNVKFSTNPIREEKYLTAKVKIFNGVNRTNFTDDKIPKEKKYYVFIDAINIDSIIKINKKVYPQVSLEQCNYKLKKRKLVDFIDKEVELSGESDYESN